MLIDDKEDILLTYKCNNKELGDLFSSSINHNLAPEVYSFHQVTNAADWYSFGAILYELLVGMVNIFFLFWDWDACKGKCLLYNTDAVAAF